MINGISMFSIDYDVSANTDTLRLSSTAAEDSPALLQIHYNPAGRIRRITPSDDIAPLNITYDSSGRKSKIAWGSWKHQFTYDSSSRVTEHAIDGAQVPVKMSYSGAARRPSEIQQDGAKFGIHYDNYDRLKEVVSPSQETSTFSSIALGGDEWVLKRRTPLNSRPSVVRIDRNGKILEATTPDEMHHYLERKDASGKITEILNDEETTVVTHWSPEGVPMATRSRDLVMNSTLQGHLLARRTVTMMGMSSSFTYEYDDLLRLTTILPVVEQSALEPIQISYDEKRGHVASINGFLWARDVSTARCQGHGMMYETSKADEHRQIVQRKVIFGDARASLKITRDRAGRAAETVLEVTSSSSGSPITQTTKRTFDATGRLASVNQQSETTRIQWNGDGRVEKINDRIVEYSRGGALKTYLDTKYHVDSIGWVHRRGNDTNTKFQYDGKGRLISATQKNLVVKIVYDVEDRVVKIQKNDDVTHLYYAYVDHPKLVSHFSKNGKISTIFYDDDQVPFAVQTDEGTRLAVLADETGSIRAIVGKDSDVVVLPERSIFGAPAPLETLTEPLLPLGYLGGIEIPEISVSILENGRPLDLLTGRYLSISPAAVIRMQFTGAFANSIDLMALEYERQPYRVGSVPEDFATWFSLAGLSPTILPSVHLGLPPASPIAHRLLSSFPRKLRPLSHLTTVFATQLSSDSLAPPPASTCWSIDDIGFSNLLILTENRQNGSVIVQPLADLKQDELAVITKLFDGVKSLDFATWGLVPTRHLWSVPNAKLEFSSTSFSHFTLAVNKDNVELRNGKSKIVVHFAENKFTSTHASNAQTMNESHYDEPEPVHYASTALYGDRRQFRGGSMTYRVLPPHYAYCSTPIGCGTEEDKLRTTSSTLSPASGQRYLDQ
uniref:Teneurin-like YD-shell domain-containing protein n=1 Tax=Caenorhabditis japonica TaxID=281687 RepID=A0A8R1ICS3_CAEJA